MKKFILLGILLFAGLSYGQFNLEHDYTDSTVKRINLEYSGEKYVVFDDATNHLNFYNADHSFWKFISLPVTGVTSFVTYKHISESKINPDPNIEVVFTYLQTIGSMSSVITKVISEDGSELFSDNVTSYFVDETNGLAPKLISTESATESRVYSLAGLTLEHIYTEGIVKRIKLEMSGEKYYIHDRPNGMLILFNSDHTLWKTIPTPKPNGTFFSNNIIITELQISDDVSLKAAYSYYTYNPPFYNYIGRLVSEDNSDLLTVDGAYKMDITSIASLPNKLIVSTSSSTSPLTSVYSLPGLALEHTYDGSVRRMMLENSGEKYYSSNIYETSITFYNNDHTLWKTIDLPLPDPSYHVHSVNFISETKLNSDDAIEVAYTYLEDVLLEIFHFGSAVINETGDSLLTVPLASNLYVSEIPGLGNKLIADLSGLEEQDFNYASKVYGINPNMSVNEFQTMPSAIVFPNPVKDVLNIQSSSEVTGLRLYNAAGILLKNIQGVTVSDLNLRQFPSGMYFVQLNYGDEYSSTHKIILNR